MLNQEAQQNVYFTPQLMLVKVAPAVDFYQRAFGAKVLRQFVNDDGSVHVAEMEIAGAMFHLHEDKPISHQESPENVNATTVLIGLFTPDCDKFVNQAIAAGATVINSLEDFDYGYRQGLVRDPFGHQWLIQKKI